MPSGANDFKLRFGKEEENWLERMYRCVKEELKLEYYLGDVADFHLRRTMSQLRSGTHELRVEQGRYKGEAWRDRSCVLCASMELLKRRSIS